MAFDPQSVETMTHCGRHLLIDLFGAKYLDDDALIQKACEEAAIATGATIIDSRFHHFGSGYGVSGVCVLAESHLSTHTWPEIGVGTFDIYVCGNCNPNLAVPVLERYFEPTKTRVSSHIRGDLTLD